MVNEEFLNTLRPESLQVQLKSSEKYGGAVDIDSMIKVLQELKKAYSHYSDILFVKRFGQFPKGSQKKRSQLTEENKLLVVDLSFSSMNAAVTPNYATSGFDPGDQVNFLDWKRNVFQSFKKEVFTPEILNESFVDGIADKYSEDERRKIYDPVIKLLSSEKFRLNFKTYSQTEFLHIKRPNKKIAEKLVPKASSDGPRGQEKVYHAFFTTTDEYDLLGQPNIKTLRVKEVHAMEELDDPIYPYEVSKIRLGDEEIELKNILRNDVSIEDDLIIIENQKLNIHVFESSRESAESVFNSTFISHYKHFALEDDENLLPKALKLKREFLGIVKVAKINEA